jgi:hypothetical protein
MGNEDGKKVVETLVAPLGSVLRSVGASLAEAQHALDENSIATQRAIDIAIESGEIDYDLQASWYHFPEVNLELKMALSLNAEAEVDKKGKVRGYRPILKSAPINATYKNTYNYDVRGSSQIKAKIVSIPPVSKIQEE